VLGDFEGGAEAMSWIKRFAIFGLLWPSIAMFVGAALTETHGKLLQAAEMTFFLAPVVYLILIGPALALAFVDRVLVDLPVWVRLAVVCVVGFFGPAMFLATGSDASKFLQFGTAGLVATVICSLLANVTWKRGSGK
jgi:hypothetical protein